MQNEHFDKSQNLVTGHFFPTTFYFFALSADFYMVIKFQQQDTFLHFSQETYCQVKSSNKIKNRGNTWYFLMR